MLIDTHCHLHDATWFTPEQQADFLQAARENGVEKIVCIGTNHEDSLRARNFATQHEDVYWTYGIHPEFCRSPREENASIFFRGDAQNIKRSEFANSIEEAPAITLSPFQESPEATAEDEDARPPRRRADATSCPEKDGKDIVDASLVAIGEIGLDYHYDGYDRPTQIKLFEQMLQLATDCNLPVSIHIREAFPDAFAVLDNFPQIRGVVHSFTGSKKDLRRALDRGFYIGVNGLVTYTTPPLPPLDRILLETDAPFLTPVPFRGTINQPGYVKQIAAYLATKLGVTELEIAEQTTKNARQIFKI